MTSVSDKGVMLNGERLHMLEVRGLVVLLSWTADGVRLMFRPRRNYVPRYEGEMPGRFDCLMPRAALELPHEEMSTELARIMPEVWVRDLVPPIADFLVAHGVMES